MSNRRKGRRALKWCIVGMKHGILLGNGKALRFSFMKQGILVRRESAHIKLIFRDQIGVFQRFLLNSAAFVSICGEVKTCFWIFNRCKGIRWLWVEITKFHLAEILEFVKLLQRGFKIFSTLVSSSFSRSNKPALHLSSVWIIREISPHHRLHLHLRHLLHLHRPPSSLSSLPNPSNHSPGGRRQTN